MGGMGPEATLAFFQIVLDKTASTDDQGHLHLLIDNNPKVPNRNLAVAGKGPSPAPVLAEMARGLERAGADFLVMVCNAAHAFQDSIVAAVSIPFISIIDETRDEVMNRVPEVTQVGLLASSGCIDAGLYQRAFASRNVEVLVPEGDGSELFMRLLYVIKSGDKPRWVVDAMKQVAEGLVDRGAQVIVAGCTEVPLVLGVNDLSCPLIDSTEVLAQSSIRQATSPAAQP
jgi:aspartate racemase